MGRANKPMRWPAIASMVFCFLVVSAFLWASVYPIPPQDGNLPLRNYVFRLAPPTRDLMFVRMCLFAEIHGFTIHIGATDPERHSYNVILKRADLFLWGANPWDDFSFDVGFHVNTGFEVSDIVLDALVEDMRKTIEQIPGSRTLKTLQDP